MLSSISVENYRSFASKASLTLRPITILLGRNSAGKSSITRLFPLLQQSMERATSAPILWSSQSIDFGKLSDVINRKHPNNPLKITFSLVSHSMAMSSWRYQVIIDNVERYDDLLAYNVDYTASLNVGKDGKTEYSNLRLQIGSDAIDIRPRGDSADIYINGNRFLLPKSMGRVIFNAKRLFPHIGFAVEKDGRAEYADLPKTAETIEKIFTTFVDVKHHKGALHLVPSLNKPTLSMPFVPRKNVSEYIRRNPGYKGLPIDNKTAEKLADLLLVTYVGMLVETISAVITPTLNNLSYLGPVRASGNRFYRDRELSVDKIDDKGENLATYIGSLSGSEIHDFNNILRTAFGVEVRSHQVEGHVSIEIGKPGDDVFDNLADVGFGFSQLLPLVAQIHADGRGRTPYYRDMGSQQITAVEQPELHLHPAYQANIADLFVAAVAGGPRRNKRPTIILETHSEALLGRLGELVIMDRISRKDIAVHFVDKDEETGTSTIRMEEFDEDGMIENWPVGFFSARRL